MGCEAVIKLNTTKDGQKLIVSILKEEHNHAVNEEVFHNLCQQRRMSEEEKENVSDMLKVKANLKKVQSQLIAESGKRVLLKDLHNVKTKQKLANKEATVLERSIGSLSVTNGSYVKLITNENDELRGLFYQDQRMRDTFARYPEFLCIDATYKLNDLRMPCYILLVENGNGQSEIVAMWIVADETEDMITEAVQIFKNQNPKWENVKLVMSDKDFVERGVFRRLLPDAKLKICLFHVLRTFRREITADKMRISTEERTTTLEILQNITYARNADDYDKHYNTLKQSCADAVCTYFDHSWHPIRHEWLTGLSAAHCLGNHTNNRLESINQKLKQVISKHSKIDEFCTDFVAFLGSHRAEIDGKLSKAVVKVPVQSPTDPDVLNYRKSLTQYAFGLIENQMTLSHRENATTYTEEGYRLDVSADGCKCSFFVQYNLPCKHIFALRRHQEKSIYDDALIPERWIKQYYLQGLGSTEQPMIVQSGSLPKAPRPKTQHEKFRIASNVSQKVAACISEATGQEFKHRMSQLTHLLDAWQRGESVVIEILTVDTDNPTTVSNANVQTVQNAHAPSMTNDDANEEVPIIEAEATVLRTDISTDGPSTIPDRTNAPSLTDNDANEEVPIIEAVATVLRTDISTDGPSTIPDRTNAPSLTNNDANEEVQTTEAIAAVLSTDVSIDGPTAIPDINNATSLTNNDANEAVPTTDAISTVLSTGVSTDGQTAIPVLTNITNITLPSTIRKRGRPKGIDLTVIGIVRKKVNRLRLKKRKREQPAAYTNLSDTEKAAMVLSWFMPVNTARAHIKDRKLIKEDMIKADTEQIFLGVKDIDLTIIRPFVNAEAWVKIHATQQTIAASGRAWTCKVCDQTLETRCVGCDCCLHWLHYHCARIDDEPETELWFCAECQTN